MFWDKLPTGDRTGAAGLRIRLRLSAFRRSGHPRTAGRAGACDSGAVWAAGHFRRGWSVTHCPRRDSAGYRGCPQGSPFNGPGSCPLSGGGEGHGDDQEHDRGTGKQRPEPVPCRDGQAAFRAAEVRQSGIVCGVRVLRGRGVRVDPGHRRVRGVQTQPCPTADGGWSRGRKPHRDREDTPRCGVRSVESSAVRSTSSLGHGPDQHRWCDGPAGPARWGSEGQHGIGSAGVKPRLQFPFLSTGRDHDDDAGRNGQDQAEYKDGDRPHHVAVVGDRHQK